MCDTIITRSETGLCRRHAALEALNREGLQEMRAARQKEAIWRPEIRAKLLRGSANAREARLGWCPVEYRESYRALALKKGENAKSARRMIEDLIKADARRYHATGQLQQSRRA